MDGVGNLAGWRWIFILEGMITILFAVIAWGFLPADLGSAKFFSEEERQFARQSKLGQCPSYAAADVLHSVSRFRRENEVTATAQMSEAAQPISTVNPELDKTEESQGETSNPHITIQAVHQEDEKFEWGEVIRGTTTCSLLLGPGHYAADINHRVQGPSGMDDVPIIPWHNREPVFILAFPVSARTP